MRSTNSFLGLAVFCLALFADASSAAESAATPKEIAKAIDRGVAHLKQIREADGTWSYLKSKGLGNYLPPDYKGMDMGATALVALTLLECGTPAKDKMIQTAADAVREQTVINTNTYALSLGIMFLDRLGDPGDIALIESMTVRLLAGQTRMGGWTYQCPSISPAEMRRLTKHIKDRNELASKGKLPTTGKRRTTKDLPEEIVAQIVAINRQGGTDAQYDDNSNTQFATLALWISRRHGMPVDDNLRRIDARFRTEQLRSGAWTYLKSRNMRTPGWEFAPSASMTCAGLLGLAVNHGAVNDKAKSKGKRKVRDPDKDISIKAGLVVLGQSVGDPAGDLEKTTKLGRFAGKSYYFLWSLERVAMVYGLKTIGKKDWYGWGAEILLANQMNDGRWHGEYPGGGADTCFALLFLKRSNLAQDLTSTLKGSIRNAGISSLKSGGVGGDSLVDGGKKKVINGVGRQDKPPKDTKIPDIKKPRPPVIDVSKGDQADAIAKLSTALVQAPEDKQEDLIDQLKNGKGLKYTEALAGSIPLLKGKMKSKARQALVTRMMRMAADTLRDKLQDDNLEVRRAAALACAQKKSKTHIPDLIKLLSDPEVPVTQAAYEALVLLTGKNFGPDADATRSERKKAIEKWKAWWMKTKG